MKKQITIPIFIPHLGCPHRCSFCNQNKTSGHFDVPNASEIANIIDQYRKSAPNSVERFEIAFFGGSFTAISQKTQSELLESARTALNNSLIHGIRLSTRPDYIDSKILDFLKEFSVQTIELGAQSFFNDVLKASNRGHTKEQIINASEMIKNAGFDLVLQLLPGLPLDNREKSLESANIAAKLKPNAVRLYPVIVLENTDLAKDYSAGKFMPMEMNETIDLLAEMLIIFNNNNIPVIRIGLHPFNEIEKKSILAGPYHPSIGFLARSRVKRYILNMLFSEKPILSNNIWLTLPDTSKEEFIGNHRENIIWLENKYNVAIKYEISKLVNRAQIHEI